MAKYIFFNFPADGHVNPTLAIVAELVARGEEVIYYLPERFRQTIEATGTTFRPYQSTLFTRQHEQSAPPVSQALGDQRIAMLLVIMIQESLQVIPQLLESVRAEQADCLVYDSMFLWGRIVAQTLHLPAIALHPSYAANQQSNVFGSAAQRFQLSPERMAILNSTLAQLSALYGVPPCDMRSILMHTEPLIIVFLPRAFQPGGETFDERYLFVGPSFQPHRDERLDFPFEQLGIQPLLYIALGTVFNHQANFYRTCFTAFGGTAWRVMLSVGPYIERTALPAIPGNFIVAPRMPQLEVLSRANLFISHGGMNSVMESLSYGVPLVVIPQISEQAVTAQRVQELGLGIALDREMATAERLREAVAQIAHDPSFRTRTRVMQQAIRVAGGWKLATDAIMQFVHTQMWV
ncbi:MAG TPA: macrolide family glycosyltransferase [Ktedonobacteraceae bacterium]